MSSRDVPGGGYNAAAKLRRREKWRQKKEPSCTASRGHVHVSIQNETSSIPARQLKRHQRNEATAEKRGAEEEKSEK